MTLKETLLMPWIYLVISGLLECAWATALKSSEGFTKLGPSLVTLVALAASMGLLSLAARELPIGTAYAIWVGIGALGTAVLGILLFGEPASLPRLLCLGGLMLSLIGLKLTG
jgi:quaternary ammonium compound-resistance protein SugE